MMQHFTLYPWGDLNSLRKNPGEALKDLADCGFNASCFVLPAEYDACRAAGLEIYSFLGSDYSSALSALSKDKNTTSEQIRDTMRGFLANLPKDVKAVYIEDEPGASEFSRLAEMAQCVREYTPWAEPYFNLFPNYAICGAEDISQLETETYEEYLDRFAATVKPDCISLDNYISFISMDMQDKEWEPKFYLNYIQAQECCQKHGIPFQHVICSNQLRAYQTPPSFANLAFQAYTSLAAGAKAIGWFTYTGRGGYLYAPIDDNGEKPVKTDTWYLLREINRRILPTGEMLFPMQWQGMYFTHADRLERAKPVSDCPALQSFTSDEPCMIGHFTDGDDDVLMIVNTSMERSTRIDPNMGGDYLVYNHNSDKFEQPILTNKHGATSPMWLNAGCGVAIRKAK